MKSKDRKIYKAAAQILFLLVILLVWEATSRMHIFGPNSQLVFPGLGAIGKAFVKNFKDGFAGTSLWVYIFNSMKLLLKGLAIGILLAFLFSGMSMVSKTFYYIYNLIVSIFDLLPGVALLPVIIAVCGIRQSVIVFLVIHAVIWPMSRNVLDGFLSVPRIYIESGRNMGLKDVSLLRGVYFPAALPYILTGVKSGWARAWRGLISAEMIFGIASMPGLGMYINQMRTNMKTSEMYATLIVIILIGAFVQYAVLEPIEKNTVKKWGMTN